jgi:hypothetical protein
MSGAETSEEAIQNAAELTELLKSGGFQSISRNSPQRID